MKRYKVRHYRSRIYNPIRGKIIKGVLIAVIVASLFAIGWFSYEPLMKAINDKNKEIIEQDPVPEKPPEPVFEPEEIEFLEKETVAVTVPEEILYSAIDYSGFLSSLDDEVTAVVIDMKTRKGTVTYRSDQVSVNAAGASAENAYTLSARIKTAKDMGLDVVTRIFAFEDSTAPYNAIDMAIRYGSAEGILWLDDSVDNGGKPWLNPYSDTAQKYILDIVYDAIDGGADAILLEGLRFPENEGMEYAYFGSGSEETPKDEVLLNFAKRIYSSAVITDTDIIIGYDSFEFISGSGVYGENPLSFSGDGYAPEIDIDDFVGKKFSDDFYFRRLPEDISEVFAKVYESLGTLGGLRVLPVLDFEGFTKEQTAGIFDYLEEKNATGFIVIYNEAYFTGVPEEPEPVVPEQNPTQPAVPTQPVTPNQPTQPTRPETPEEEPGESGGSGFNDPEDDSDDDKKGSPKKWGN
ncbi:MAG: hypothetical protein IJA17_00935 [Oscillospiraceae bacterium]|nr:hypothetical protein [Oscillospiraceae bacterium]